MTEVLHTRSRHRSSSHSRVRRLGERAVLRFLDVQSRARLRSRGRRHAIAALCSTALLALGCVTLRRLVPNRFTELAGQVELAQPRTWPWLVLSAPLWLCFPYALTAEWIRRRRRMPAWLPPLLLVPIASLVWSTLIGDAGEYEGYVSLISGLPIGAAFAAVFCTYWVPLLIAHHRSARQPRSSHHAAGRARGVDQLAAAAAPKRLPENSRIP
jgi:hypothetical protein